MSKDLRKHYQQTNKRLLVGFFVIVFLVGEGLIYLLYGKASALMGLTCLLGAMVPVVGIGVFFWILEKVVGKQ
ncbi:MAG: hypothetical protein MAG431_00471 [Chloroflexi bacterium]|nr:hypothetical protein [Chloroflexota bacterium]